MESTPEPPTHTGPPDPAPLTLREVFHTWWPLAASWLMMASELPVLSAVVARQAHPSIHLAAYGGVVFPIALVVEAPIIMLLAASTALSRDWTSYVRLRRFMLTAGAGLTAVHLLVALTPLYDWIVGSLMHAPVEIRAPARLGLLIMTPWTGSIAYRRFQQGVLIRFDRSRLVGVGTAVRVTTNFSFLALGYLARFPGIVTATTAVAAGVVAEAIFAGLCVRPVLAGPLRAAPPAGTPLTLRRLLHFYVPLAMTPLLSLFSLPILSAGMGRMPLALESLATWPVVNGLIFAFRSTGLAYNEVVIALLDRVRPRAALARFTVLLAGTTSILFLILAYTPLGRFWMAGISGLPPALADLGLRGLRLAFVLPALGVVQNWFQGNLVHAHRTRGVSEAVGLALITLVLVTVAGVHLGSLPGLVIGVLAMIAGNLVQTVWLTVRTRGGGAPILQAGGTR